jgi:hypothetical protein
MVPVVKSFKDETMDSAAVFRRAAVAWAALSVLAALASGRDPLSLDRETRFYLGNRGLIFRMRWTRAR